MIGTTNVLVNGINRSTLEKIKDESRRSVTYSKRKRGLIKKAMELSQLCNQDIYLLIFDREKQKLVQYMSSLDFNG